jgi:hypothetical protein
MAAPRRTPKKKKAHHEQIERVGVALYGSFWIGELQTKEWEIGKKSGADHHATARLPSSGKKAATIAKAHFRSRASREQYEQVTRWLGEQEVFSDISASDFNNWFRKRFPQAPLSSTESRKRAERDLLDAGSKPGRGGNITWRKFHEHVEKRSGYGCTVKTVMRDVRKIRRTSE